MCLYSFYCNKICYANNDSKLVLSHYSGYDCVIINDDINFVNSIIDIILIEDYIILRTNTNDIYYYVISRNQLIFLTNYFVVKIICNCVDMFEDTDDDEIIVTWNYHLLITTDTKIILFENFVLSKEFTISGSAVDLFCVEYPYEYYVRTNTDETYVLDNILSIIIILEKPYKSIVKFRGDYYCLHCDGNIDVI
jgi:hypothetical protein